MRNTMPEAYTAVPVTFAGMAVTLPESLRSRSPESSVTLPESPVTFDRNTHQIYGSIEAQHQRTILIDFIDHLADFDRMGRDRP